MKKMLTASLVALLFVGGGCRKDMTNDEIIAESKKCHDAGMRPVQFIGFSGVAYAVACREIEKVTCITPTP